MANALLNWKEIDLILSELALPGSVINQAYQPKPELVIFELYRERRSYTLLFSLSPSFGRVHVTTRNFPKPKKLQRFVSFLRAHVVGGTIRDAYQVGKDRIVKLIIVNKEEKLVIWVRLWGGSSNMIVSDEIGNILDACYRRPGKNEVSGGFYNPEASVGLPAKVKKGNVFYEVRELPGEGTFNERVERFYSEQEQTSEKATLLKSLEALFHERENYLHMSLEQAESKLGEYLQSERLRELGDIIMASMQETKKGDTWLRAADFYNDNFPVEIELDPRKSPQENANEYYEKYKKAKAGLERVRENIDLLKSSIEALAKKKALATDNADIRVLRDTILYLRKKEKHEPGKSGFEGLSFFDSGYDFLVGRSAAENDLLLRRFVKGNDYWFHVRDYPGAYVFVRGFAGKSLPLEIMLDAGNVAVFYSKAKQSGKADVYYTRVKYLRRVKDGKKGLVIPMQEKNLYIVLDEERVTRLKNL
jgi:predicted ribosome quality control (RQC) complex YloA/Tae2 family protein